MDARSERVARRFDPWLLAAAVLVIPVMVIEQSEIADPWPAIAGVANWLIWLAFFAETVTMLAIVPNRGEWIRRHPIEVAIVLLTPPFFPASLQGLRAVRLLRLLRILRIMTAARRLFTLEGLQWAAVAGLLVILGGGAAFVAVEDQALSTWDGVWWALTTATTVGYGDVFPQTDAGRVIAMGVMSTGIGIVALFTAAIAGRFLRTDITAAVSEVEADDDAILAEVAAIQHRLTHLEELLRSRTGQPGEPGAT